MREHKHITLKPSIEICIGRFNWLFPINRMVADALRKSEIGCDKVEGKKLYQEPSLRAHVRGDEQ